MFEKQLLAWLRVPPEPAPPDGSPDSIRIFRAGRNYYYWRLLTWGLSQAGVVLLGAMILMGTFNNFTRQIPAPFRLISMWIEAAGLVAVLLSLPITFFMQRLNYRLRWYIVTDRSLRIRSGIWSVEELTMTYANIQDLAVTSGPLQGLLGLADIEVRSAGGGGGSDESAKRKHAARFEGVENADALRDLIAERLRRYRDAGLGDPDQPLETIADPHAAALRVLEEARALRAATTGA